MCPLWPLHYILMYTVIIGPLWLLSFRVISAGAESAGKWNVVFSPTNISSLTSGQLQSVNVTFNRTQLDEEGTLYLEYVSLEPSTAKVNPSNIYLPDVPVTGSAENQTLSFEVKGDILGRTKIQIKRKFDKSDEGVFASNDLPVVVLREKSVLDTIFITSVAILMIIIYVNMGAAIDTNILIAKLKRPIGPIIGFLSQFVIMPLLAYFIGMFLLPRPDLRLGLFVTGCSPGGGASNVWTLALGGNLDLSIAMTAVSTFAAFGMMPLWIFTLGSTITKEANLEIPYRNLVTFVFALIIPLAIGILIQRKYPNIAKMLVRVLKPFALCIIIYIVGFAIYTNWYLVGLFTWKILLAGLLLPWLGYILGGGMGWLCRQNWRDIIAIGVETGVQNTGLAILTLRIALSEPEDDITTVIPVAVAIMTPILPTIGVLVQKLTGKCSPPKKESLRGDHLPVTHLQQGKGGGYGSTTQGA